MITHQQIVEQELTAKTLEILQLKIQLANFSNENENLKKQLEIIKSTANQGKVSDVGSDLRKNLNRDQTLGIGPSPVEK